jgi:hypothetical protein
MRALRTALGLALAAAMAAASTPARADDPVSSSVRFTGEIVRIFDRKCQPCHGGDRLAMPLSAYRDVRAWGRAIREEIVEQRMPPWTAARGYGRFRNDLSLSAREVITVLSWIDGGMPRGDDKDLPVPPRPSPAAAPDVRVTLPAQRIPALEPHVVRRIAIAVPQIDAGRSIGRIALVPGERRLLTGALVYDAGARNRRWLGAWLPWQHEAAAPEGHGFRLAPGSRLEVELYYRGADADLSDASALEVFYAPAGAAGIDEVTAASDTRLARGGTLWAIVPSAGATAASFQLTARQPDGETQVLLWMPQLRHEWPQALLLDAPLPLPAGTTLSVVTHPADPSARARLSLLR